MTRLKSPRSTLPAITHVDYSARVQTVAAEDNPRFHQLLREFEKNTGCSVLVNTSFNVRGEPPVCTPEDAFRCFMRTEMDYLVLGNFLLNKEAQTQLLGEEYQKLDRSPRALRRFGLTLGSALLLLAALLFWRHHRALGLPFAALGTLFVLVAGVAPLLLKWIHGPWMILSLALGWLMTRVLLTTAFFLIVTPIGLLQHLFGKRPLEIAFRTGATSYWQPRTAQPLPADYEKQF